MLVYLIRHAESLVVPGMSDFEKYNVGISDLGKLQAKATAKKIRGFNIKRLVSSPILRAKETAEFIKFYTNLPIETDDRLREFFPDPNQKDTGEQKRIKYYSYSNPQNVTVGGESFDGAIKRLEEILDELGSKNSGNLCLVTHRVIVEGFLYKNFGIKSSEHEWLRPASISCIDLSGDMKRLVFYDLRPLDTELVIEIVKRRFRYILTK
ncbi:hypothetical protein COW81_02005 [Candidatus Campbellbacteria bacterium CG22_combo_CG10-13_8_21_14_all_36_13]|uniref:Histidine phosphatase family protein n=1 Tax=Candidatus Campbellbacteria bacterium CG22_combo_CG10-13_8_21_14_all_36_13 TaxID=1974529 RepID=A0A2H0DY65_9BACT|nr:MAG: hypothetical protein COW81_02005 [Candidatus Campbellbacteria bacterium CG22_combo_CG10-13_8_21_14_all_36_13]